MMPLIDHKTAKYLIGVSLLCGALDPKLDNAWIPAETLAAHARSAMRKLRDKKLDVDVINLHNEDSRLTAVYQVECMELVPF